MAAATAPISTFKPALIIVDVQEDFCPPSGPLAIPDGRAIVSTINALLALPFVLKVATKDWHPTDHISFASNHPSKKPFVDTTTVTNPFNPSESYETRLWPDHCIQNTPGAELIPELDISQVDKVVEKGLRKEVEMYSAFYDPLVNPRVSDSGLGTMLRERDITHAFVVGLAFDYCVRATAIDAKKEGFTTVVIREGTRAVDPSAWERVEGELRAVGVKVVGVHGEEVRGVAKVES